MTHFLNIDAVKLLEQSKEEEDDDNLIWSNQITVIFTVMQPGEDAVVITPFRVPRHRLTDESHKSFISRLLAHTTHLPSQFHNHPSIVRRVCDATSQVPSNTRRLNVLLKPNEGSCYTKCFWHVLGEEFCDVGPSITTPKKRDTGNCSICFDEIRVGSKGCYLPCSHVFHVKCIDEWFEYRRYSCPLCRCRLVEKIS